MLYLLMNKHTCMHFNRYQLNCLCKCPINPEYCLTQFSKCFIGRVTHYRKAITGKHIKLCIKGFISQVFGVIWLGIYCCFVISGMCSAIRVSMTTCRSTDPAQWPNTQQPPTILSNCTYQAHSTRSVLVSP